MPAWEKFDSGKVMSGIPLVRYTIVFGRVTVTMSRSSCEAYHGVWVMTCWPWASGMPLQASGEDLEAAKKEALEWLRGKAAELITQIKWSNV